MKTRTKLLAALLLVPAGALLGLSEAETAAKAAADGKFIRLDRQNSAAAWKFCDLSVPRPGRPVSIWLIPKSPIDLRIIQSDGVLSWIKMNVMKQAQQRPENKALKLPQRKVELPDSCLEFEGLPIQRLYIKPNLEKLDDEALSKIDLNACPAASRSLVHLRLEPWDNGTPVYVNGSYAGKIPGAPIVSFSARLRGAEEVLDLSMPESPAPDFEKIDLGIRAMHGLHVGLKLDSALPVPVRTDVSKALDLRAAAASGGKTGYRSPDLTRTAFDGLPSSFLFSVPAEQYSRAWILCSPIPDRKNKPVFNLAMTRYARYGRAALDIPTAEADLSVPSGGIRKVGAAELEFDGRKENVPVYLVELMLDHGAIQDIIYDDPHAMLPFRDYLDIDLQGPGPRAVSPKIGSAVAVYAVTLEKVPANLHVFQAEKGNVFHNDEKPRIPVEVTARVPGRFQLAWDIADVEGKKVHSDRLILDLKKGETRKLEIPVAASAKGWFGVDFTLSGGGKVFSTHKTAAALLPPDTRKGRAGSPYSVWFFGSSHQLRPDPEIIGPILYKAGIHSFAPSTDIEESYFEPWKITFCQIPDGIRKNIFTEEKILSDDPELWRKMENDYRYEIDKFLRRFPNCRQALLFHESYPREYPFLPNLMLGREPAKFDAGREKIERARIKCAETVCRIYRKYYPQIKIVFGNSCWAQGMIEAFAARGFDPGLIDYIGCEAPGSWIAWPESFSTWNPAGSSYFLRETARLAKFDKPVTATFEWTCRTSNLNELGPGTPHGQAVRQAQWLIRDVLTAYAYGYSLIPLMGVTDTGTAYNNGRTYGAPSLLTRQFKPKPVYVAAATATRILDRVQFKRAVPGELDVYLFELERKDGNNIYAFWTSKGKALCELTVEGTGAIDSEDLFGRPSKLVAANGKITLEAGESMRYLITKNKILKFKTLVRSFDTPPEPEKRLASFQFKAGDFIRDTEPEPHIDGRPFHERYFQASNLVPAVIADVNDPEKGECVSVRFDLSKLPKDSWNHGGYSLFKLKKPIDLPANADGIGLWVKGNGSCGRLVWEVTDSGGNTFISNGDRKNGSESLNWLYENEFDFTGWRFLSMALTRRYAKPAQWFSMQWDGKGTMRPPLKLTGILFSSSQKIPHIFELVPVENQEIRFGRLTLFNVDGETVPSHAVAVRPASAAMRSIPPDPKGALLLNGGFETLAAPSPAQCPEKWVISSAEFPVGWALHPTPGKVTGTAAVVTQNPASGKNCMRIEGMYVGLRQELNIAGKDTSKVRVCFQARGTGLAAARLICDGKSFGSLRMALKPDEWQEVSGIIESPGDAKTKVLFIQQGAAKGYIEVDDVKVDLVK